MLGIPPRPFFLCRFVCFFVNLNFCMGEANAKLTVSALLEGAAPPFFCETFDVSPRFLNSERSLRPGCYSKWRYLALSNNSCRTGLSPFQQ